MIFSHLYCMDAGIHQCCAKAYVSGSSISEREYDVLFSGCTCTCSVVLMVPAGIMCWVTFVGPAAS